MSDWGLSLRQHLVKHLEHLQNCAVHLLFHLHKFDHIKEYYHQSEWLSFPELNQYHSLCVRLHQFHCCGRGIELEPPIQFSQLTDYHTRTKNFHTCEVLRICHSFRDTFITRFVSGRTHCHQASRAMRGLMILKLM